MKKNNLDYKNGILILRLSNYFNLKRINKFIIPKIDKYRFKYLIINFSKIKYISKKLLNELKKSLESIINNNGIICICNCYKKIKLSGIIFVNSEIDALNLLAL